MARFKPDEAQVSEAVRRLNPELFGLGALPAAQPKQVVARPLGSPNEERKKVPRRVGKGSVECVVTMVRYCARLLDDDNLAGSFKPMRDAIAKYLNVDDADPRVRWECGQVETRGAQGVSVKISRV
jgi:hypothetical protein